MAKNRRHFIRYTLPMWLWAALMLTVSSLPGTSLPQGNMWEWDKFAHAFEYMVLGILMYRYVVSVHRVSFAKANVLVAVCIPLFGVVDEIHQLFIPFRSCTWQDMVADAGGAIIAIVLMQIGFLRKRIIGD
ncbi:MAG: VanZ family protein [Chitinivibrionales bacterium]